MRDDLIFSFHLGWMAGVNCWSAFQRLSVFGAGLLELMVSLGEERLPQGLKPGDDFEFYVRAEARTLHAEARTLHLAPSFADAGWMAGMNPGPAFQGNRGGESVVVRG